MSMIFDIDEIPADGLNFEICEKKESFKISDCSLLKDVVISGDLNKIENDIYFAGHVSTELSAQCSRCLEPARAAVDIDASARYVPQAQKGEGGSEAELHESDIDVEYYKENRIDLAQPIYDQILLSLPLVNLCKPECQGLCPACGINLNKGSCSCGEGDTVDPRLAVLKTLKDKLKK